MKLKIKLPDLKEGRGLAYVGMVTGIALSVAGNLGHAWVPPAHAPADWEPNRGVVFSATIWPIILFLMFEIMVSLRWPKDWYFHVVRWGVLGAVAGIAAVASYQHMSSLLEYWGETKFVWHFGPLAVDGLLIMSSTALIIIRMGLAPDTDDASDASDTPPAKEPAVKSKKVVPDAKVPESAAPGPPPSNGNGSLSENDKKILAALPGTTSAVAAETGIGRTTVDYALKNRLSGLARQDADKIWHPVTSGVRS